MKAQAICAAVLAVLAIATPAEASLESCDLVEVKYVEGACIATPAEASLESCEDIFKAQGRLELGLGLGGGAKEVNCTFDHLPIIGPITGDPTADNANVNAHASGYDECTRDKYTLTYEGGEHSWYKIYFQVTAWSGVQWDSEGFVDWSMSGELYGDFSGRYASAESQYYEEGKSYVDGVADSYTYFEESWTPMTVHVGSSASVDAHASVVSKISSRDVAGFYASYECTKQTASS